ncbi:MAG: 30S ribosomal protein S15 [Phycisphaeraceae bacterium]|nr:30S ribosomal protein S15 [Phycisphaerales bacterium]MCA9307415.1 30S ribosomal protein S15 [Phycisphaerales bacterium]MCB9843450.1 30S ribosomal protein S15 [Phycisphaeraceae bacterium]
MAISQARKAELMKDYGRNEHDSGSPEVQVAILTENIRELTEHMKDNKHDYSSRRGLMGMVSKRTRLTNYLKRTDRDSYLKLIDRLGLRK